MSLGHNELSGPSIPDDLVPEWLTCSRDRGSIRASWIIIGLGKSRSALKLGKAICVQCGPLITIICLRNTQNRQSIAHPCGWVTGSFGVCYMYYLGCYRVVCNIVLDWTMFRHSPKSSIIRSAHKLNLWHMCRDYTFKITATSPRDQWINIIKFHDHWNRMEKLSCWFTFLSLASLEFVIDEKILKIMSLLFHW